MSESNIGPCFYFGCKKQAGHFLFNEQGWQASRSSEIELPFRYHILDGGLLPAGRPEVQGEAVLVHIGSHTVVSFWDRSVDTRGGCNSSFVIPSHVDFSTAIAISKERFPWVWERINFEVKEQTWK